MARIPWEVSWSICAVWCMAFCMKRLIKNGTVYTGDAAPKQLDLLLEGDRIIDMAPAMEVTEAQVLDAAGCAVTPGFVDIHRHCDIAAIYDPDFGELELAQGITSTITGNCGLAPVPSSPETRREMYDYIEPCLGPAPAGMTMTTFGDYLGALEEAKLRINVGGLVGAGAVKTAVKGYRRGAFTPGELDRAIGHIDEAMDAGAFGLSTGIMYNPECYSTADEIVNLARAAGRRGGVLTCHMRGEGDSLVHSAAEILSIARQAEIPLEISHFKSTGLANWRDKIFRAITLVEDARAGGQDVTVDFYPYTGGSTTLLSLLPPSMQQEDQAATLAQLSTEMGRERLKKAIYSSEPDWDNMVTSIGWERIVVSSVTLAQNRFMAGKDLAAIAREQGYEEPADFFCHLLVEEQGKVGIIVLSMAQEDVDTVAKLPYSLLISDALYGVGDNPHPRLYGSFPKLLREYVRERKILTLEQAIHKMTAMPARRIGLADRGILAPGNCADLLVFDPQKIQDHADYNNPKQLSTGMEAVFVGGRLSWQGQRPTEERAATALRKNQGK